MKLKDLPTKYDFKTVEKGKYEKWVKAGYFTAGDLSKKPYCVVIPPPNITGKLHLGHALDNTLQDIIVRRKRMQGYDTLYLPGMDHASIATQAKVEEALRKKGISRYDLGREKFLEKCWEWKEKHASLIHEQWKILGLSLDYTRERFTLDEGLNEAVVEVFVRMYQEGLIYRGEKIINWDIQSKTAISNIEVEYRDVEGEFYTVLYPFKDGDGGLKIATTRPETMFADVAIMVHPDDERYQSYIGKTVRIPLTDRFIPVIADDYVDQSFGTGVVKVTPAHDPNDFEVGLRHNLSRPLCMNEDGTMNELCGSYQGMERFACRKQVAKDLKAEGLLVKVEKYVHSVGHSERTGVVVEPRMSKQWFVSMEKLANEILNRQQSEEKIQFYPAHFEKIFTNWLTNIQDWCISRQLWWGHRIPAWYRGEEVYVGKTAPEGEGWVQDEDALDTWFSSALWPFSTLGWPNDTEDLRRFFPTDCLVTGYDIIFFWVARMAFQSQHLLQEKPFQDVLIHGIIRDELGRKLSKSLGNGVDMVDVSDKFGIDSLRYFLTTASSPGQDLRYSEEKIEAAWNYINKIWNISRFIGISFENNRFEREGIDKKLMNPSDRWILSRLNEVIRFADSNYDKYEFGETAKEIYKFVWNEFASWYLEMTKVVFSEGSEAEKKNTCSILSYVLSAILKLLHPFMPFVTDEIYSMFHEEPIAISAWPKANREYDFENANAILVLYDIITVVRNVRSSKNVSNSKKITIELQIRDSKLSKFIKENLHYLERFANYEEILFTDSEIDTAKKSVTVLPDVVVAIPLSQLVNVEEEVQKLTENQKRMLSEIERCEKMLSNPGFLAKAPEDKVNAEREKLAEYQKQLGEINRLLEDYR